MTNAATTKDAATKDEATPATDPGPDAEPRVLLLMDGHSLAYRAFHALPAENFSTTTGQFTNAVYGFTSMLINLLRDERPTHVAVAFDLSRQTWRREEYVEYKATRSTSPSEFNGQVELIKEVLGALRIPWVTAENYEADDVIATLSSRAVAEGMNVSICTGDRDALQLVSDQVTVLYPKRGVSELTRFTPEEVESKYGLTPLQYPDYAALRGDPSDNLPGIPGVGEKTAAKWIREFGSLTTLVDRVDEVRGKVGDALREALPSVLMNRRLTELVREVPIDDDPATDFPAVPYDREAVHRIFDDLQFRVLRERLLETFAQEDETSTEGFEVAGTRLAPGTVRAWLAAHAHRSGRSGRPRHLGTGRWRRAHPRAGRGRRGGGRHRRRAGRSRRRGSARRLVRRPDAHQGRPRPQAGDQRADRPRLAGRRRGLRHRAGRLPRPARSGHLRPERPGAAVPAPHAGPRSPGQLRAAAVADPRRGREQRQGYRHQGHGQGAGDHRPGRRAGGASGHRSGRSRCWPTWNCR